MQRLFILLFLASVIAHSQTCKTISLDATDGVVASPANHTVLFETEDIRVLDVHSTPHSAEKLHTHAYPAVMITDGFSTGSLTVEGQAPVMRAAPQDKTPRVVMLPPQGLHHAENLGDTPFHAIRVELKHPGCSLSGKPATTLDATDAVTAAPASNKVLIDDADVRVLETSLAPHTIEPMHTDAWTAVIFVTQNSTMNYLRPGGQSEPIQQTPGAKPSPILETPEGLHAIENVGNLPFHAIRVELKLADPNASAAKP